MLKDLSAISFRNRNPVNKIEDARACINSDDPLAYCVFNNSNSTPGINSMF